MHWVDEFHNMSAFFKSPAPSKTFYLCILYCFHLNSVVVNGPTTFGESSNLVLIKLIFDLHRLGPGRPEFCKKKINNMTSFTFFQTTTTKSYTWM